MNPEPLQVILHYGEIVTGESYEHFRRHVNSLVGKSLLDPTRSKMLGNISRAVDLQNIAPNTTKEIQKLRPRPLEKLINELQPEEWILLDQLLSNFT